MICTETQLQNIQGHFGAARGLLPYKDTIEYISTNIEEFQQKPKIPYETAVSLDPRFNEFTEHQYDIVLQFIELFAQPYTAEAYLTMMNMMVGNKSDQAIDRYLKKCRIRALNAKTIKNYRLSLSTFRNFYCDEWSELTQDDIDEFMLFLQDKTGLNMTSVNNRLRDLRTFINWAKEQGIINSKVKVQLIRQDEPEIQAFEPDELKEIYDACLNTRKDSFVRYRDYILMRLLEETGMRIGEALNLTTKTLDLKGLTIEIKRSKNKKGRTTFFTPDLAKELKKYLGLREQLIRNKGITTTDLFINKDGKQLHKRTIQERIAYYGKIAGITDTRCSPHTFRHYFAKRFLLQGGDVFTLSQILGHSTLEMTYLYARLFSKDRFNVYQRVMGKH